MRPWLMPALTAAVAVERLAELATSRRNRRWAMAHGGVEYGAGHYPAMVGLHVGLLGGSVAETLVCRPPFSSRLGWTMLGLVGGAQALRWWCIASLGQRWNTRVIVIPGMPPVARGPYRWLRHPNYVAVVVEGAALPMVHTAWRTALGFACVNGVLLARRIRVENAALSLAAPPTVPDPEP